MISPFLGASPDNITSCKCMPKCTSAVVEYKCPWTHKYCDPKEAFLQPEIGGRWENRKFFLLEKSNYFYQVQVLMHVAGLKKCDLVVCTTRGIFCHQVTYAPVFFEKICLKLKRSWLTKVVPHMFKKFCILKKVSSECTYGKHLI